MFDRAILESYCILRFINQELLANISNPLEGFVSDYRCSELSSI
jgi:hypothetical protein